MGLLCEECGAVSGQFLDEGVNEAVHETGDADVNEGGHLFEMVNLVILRLLLCHLLISNTAQALPGVDHLQPDNHKLRL